MVLVAEPNTYAYVLDEVGEDVHVVELDHVGAGEKLGGASKSLEVGIEFFDLVGDSLFMFEGVLDGDAEEFCVGVLF